MSVVYMLQKGVGGPLWQSEYPDIPMKVSYQCNVTLIRLFEGVDGETFDVEDIFFPVFFEVRSQVNAPLIALEAMIFDKPLADRKDSNFCKSES